MPYGTFRKRETQDLVRESSSICTSVPRAVVSANAAGRLAEGVRAAQVRAPRYIRPPASGILPDAYGALFRHRWGRIYRQQSRGPAARRRPLGYGVRQPFDRAVAVP